MPDSNPHGSPTPPNVTESTKRPVPHVTATVTEPPDGDSATARRPASQV
jgi:hypothetical protein